MENRNLRTLAVCTFLLILFGSIRDPQSGWIEGAAVILMMGAVMAVSASFAKYKPRLKQRPSAAPATVVRDGRSQEISASNLVVGDIVKINSGCFVPADGIVLESLGLKVDEAAITGDSCSPIAKNAFQEARQATSPSLSCGSKVTEGSGTMVVIAVGEDTLHSHTAETIVESFPITPLQSALESLAGKFGVAGVLSAIVVFLVLLAYVVCGAWAEGSWGGNGWHDLLMTFSVTAAIVIVAVPEGLPFVVTLALAYTVTRINTQDVLIRKFQACEMSSEMTDLCVDKTGTLTKNRLSVVEITTCERTYEESQIDQLETESIGQLLINSFCIGNHVGIAPSSEPGGHDEFRGSATDCAMAEAVKKWRSDFQTVRDRSPVVSRIPFSSARKWGAVAAKVNGENIIFLKGAFERLIGRCRFRNVNGRVEELQESEKRRLLEEMANKRTLRLLAIAYKVDSSSRATDTELDESFATQDLILLAIVAFKDTLRAGVPSTLATLQRAGIVFRMVTGDNLDTAVAVAKECGIIDAEHSDRTVMNGDAFYQISSDPQALKVACEELRVLARVTPSQKVIFVEQLQQLGKSVACVGDGTNDAPAIRRANVGFSMNCTATVITKDAAGVLLVNDDLIGVVTMLKWGRNMVHCARRYAKFQIKSVITTLAVEFIGSLILGHSPLSVIQLLWVYVIVNVFAPAAIGMRDPAIEELEHSPTPTQPLITATGKFQVIAGALYEVFCVTAVLLLAPSMLGVKTSSNCIDWSEDCERHRTLIFHTLVILQVCSLLCSQGPTAVKEICRCGPLTSVIVVILAVQFAMVQFGGAVTRCAQLTLREHELCLAIGLSALLFCSLVKVD